MKQARSEQLQSRPTSAALEVKSAGALISYMGMEIDSSTLYSQKELVRELNIYGAFDSTLDHIRAEYTSRFGNQLIRKYPFSDDMQGGGAIVPIQEGFLFLPYSSVYTQNGARYELRQVVLLDKQMVETLEEECRAYMEGLLAALGDISVYEQSHTAHQCKNPS